MPYCRNCDDATADHFATRCPKPKPPVRPIVVKPVTSGNVKPVTVSNALPAVTLHGCPTCRCTGKLSNAEKQRAYRKRRHG